MASLLDMQQGVVPELTSQCLSVYVRLLFSNLIDFYNDFGLYFKTSLHLNTLARFSDDHGISHAIQLHDGGPLLGNDGVHVKQTPSVNKSNRVEV